MDQWIHRLYRMDEEEEEKGWKGERGEGRRKSTMTREKLVNEGRENRPFKDQ